MSYAIYGEDGYVDDFCTSVGLMEMAGFIERTPGLPDLKLFMEKGYTTEPEKCSQEIDFIIEQAPKEVRSSLQHLFDSLQKVNEVAIISQ